MNPPRSAHRYLANGSTEVICMNCFDVVPNVHVEADAIPFPDTHACEIAELSNPALPHHPSSYASPKRKRAVEWRIRIPAFLRQHKGTA